MKVRSTLSTLLSSLYESLEDDGTHPHIVKGIRICTDLWLHPGRSQRPERLLQDIHFTVRNVLCEHYSFGWLNFLQGIHLSSLTAIQDSYFQFKNSSRSVEKWHSSLLLHLWDILEKVYFHRCASLNILATVDCEDHEALVPALAAAKVELARGLRRIPVLYNQYFSHTESTLTDLDATSLREWLKVVRLSREKSHDTNNNVDSFSPGGKYRSWLLSS